MNTKATLTKFILICSIIFASEAVLARTPTPTYGAMFPVFSRNNAQLIYLDNPYFQNNPSIKKISIKDGSVLKTIPLKLNKQRVPFAATPDGFKLLASSPKGIAVIHNGTGKVLRTLPYPDKNRHIDPNTYQQSPDGVLLAIPSISPNSRKILVIHTGSGKLQYTIDLLKGEKWVRYPKVRGMGFSPKRRYLAYVFEASRKSTLHVYDLYKKSEILRLKLSGKAIDQGKIQFSKNGTHLIFRGINIKNIALVNVSEKSLKTLDTGYYDYAGFTPDDNNLIIIQSYQKRVLIKNIKTGKTSVIATKFEYKEGYYGSLHTIQSADRSLLLMPLQTNDPNKINQFLLINGQNGRVLRQLKK